mmetsp:Transcript_75685/g.153563  ORF Transcript_75685/g.153563 Transcript_75685/m.153563 type:complete len:146 (+) Transcript_75685:1230-1667(+)
MTASSLRTSATARVFSPGPMGLYTTETLSMDRDKATGNTPLPMEGDTKGLGKTGATTALGPVPGKMAGVIAGNGETEWPMEEAPRPIRTEPSATKENGSTTNQSVDENNQSKNEFCGNVYTSKKLNGEKELSRLLCYSSCTFCMY